MATLTKINASLKKEDFVSKMFAGGFGVLRGDLFRLAFNGQVAIKADDGSFKTYDATTDTLTDVFDFAFDAKDMFYHVPTPAVAPGDLIINRGLPMYVKELTPEGVKVVNVIEGTIETLANSTTIMGNKFFSKVVSIFSMFGAQGTATAAANPMQNMLPFLLLSDKDGGGFGDGDNGMLKMMLYSNLFGGATGGAGAGLMQNPMMLMMLMGGDKGGLGGLFGGGEGGIGELLKFQMLSGMMTGQAAANPFAGLFGGIVPPAPRA